MTRRFREAVIFAAALCAGCAISLASTTFGKSKQATAPPNANSASAASAASQDTILAAMAAELNRSKSQLKMDNVDSPFYIEYRVFDVDQFDVDVPSTQPAPPKIASPATDSPP